MNIVFAGTPVFAVPALRALANAEEHRLIAVYTQPDRPAGRGRRITFGAVKQVALELGLPVSQPARLGEAAVTELQRLRPDAIIVAAYGLLLPAAVLTIPHSGCINVHASLLPRWRGAAPIARAIEAGDEKTGVTIMQMDAGLDTGAILAQREIAIDDEDTAQTLHDRLAQLGAELLIETLARVACGEVTPTPQPATGACPAQKLRKAEALLDWSEPAIIVGRKIRAFNPWPVAHTRFRGRLLRLWETGRIESAPPGHTVSPGTLVAVNVDAIRVRAGEGIVPIRCLQLEGGKPLPAAAFINGYHPEPGERLG
ncbi:MAG: methionyl-tRNA formyltransferase [Acidiferrobacterales bacterium]